MRVATLFTVVLSLVISCVWTSAAQDVSKLTEPERKQENDWMAERAEKTVSVHRLESEINQAWAETKYSTPELDALRKRYRDLQMEMLRIQADLQKKVAEVPEVQEKIRQHDAGQKQVQELSQKIAEKTGGNKK